jgi:hypothetical protein
MPIRVCYCSEEPDVALKSPLLLRRARCIALKSPLSCSGEPLLLVRACYCSKEPDVALKSPLLL